MKKNNWFIKSTALVMMAVTVFVSSCNEEERLTAEDSISISEESISEAYYEDADDMSSVVVYETSNPSGGREATGGKIASDDERIVCATISILDGSNAQSGQITIDFGAGCVVRGNTRSGKIILTYSGGPRGTLGFTVVTTFENYKINGIELKGTRTVTKIAASVDTNIKHSITLVDGEAIWPDNGGHATRNSEFTREWVRDPADERVVLEGNATGTTRRGKSYEMNITDPLVYKRACMLTDGIHMAVQGTKVFTTNNKQIVIDYGDGACDRQVTVTVNGTTRNINVGSN